MSDRTSNTAAAATVADASPVDVTRLVDAAEHLYDKQYVMLELWWDATERRPLATRRVETPLDTYVIAAGHAVGPSDRPRGVDNLVRLLDTCETTAPADAVLMAAFCVRLDTLEEIHREVFLSMIDADTGDVIPPDAIRSLACAMIAREGLHTARHVSAEPYRSWLVGTIDRRVRRSLVNDPVFVAPYLEVMRALDSHYAVPILA